MFFGGMGHVKSNLAYLLMTKLSVRASSSSMLFTAKGDVCAESLYAFASEYSWRQLFTTYIGTCIHTYFYHPLRHALLSLGLAQHEYQPVWS